MVNRNYKNGRAKEYRIIEKLKKAGYDIVFRSAGSHSSIDIVAIRKSDTSIVFVQSKPKKFSKNKAQELCLENEWLNNRFFVSFNVW